MQQNLDEVVNLWSHLASSQRMCTPLLHTRALGLFKKSIHSIHMLATQLLNVMHTCTMMAPRE